MINRILIVVFFSSLLLGCKYDLSSQGSIKGEGEIVKQEINLEALRGLNLSINGDVVISPGTTQKVVLEGQQNILDNIKREVKNGVWNIAFVKHVSDAKDVKVYVTMPTMEEVGLAGSGSIRTDGKFTSLNHLDVNVSGSGHSNLEYDAASTEISLSGSGKVDLLGSSKTLSINISGSGDVTAANLVAEDCSIHISGSGDASVNASKTLDTHITGSGDVAYTGTASVTTKISGSGEVNKIK